MDRKSNLPHFAFEGKPFIGDLILRRSPEFIESSLVQVQLFLGNEVISTVNSRFEEKQNESFVTLSIPPLPRGQHLLSLKVLPIEEEKLSGIIKVPII